MKNPEMNIFGEKMKGKAALDVSEKFRSQVFGIKDNASFEKLALELFAYQYGNNPVYKLFVDSLGRKITEVNEVTDIPFLPISFFKTHKVLCGTQEPQVIFSSSGTSGTERSSHVVSDTSLYEESFRKAFKIFYGDIKEFTVLALLPSYLERNDSSLVYMVNDFIKQSGSAHSGFYLGNLGELVEKLAALKKERRKVLLLGVSFALLEFAEQYSLELGNTVVMETGGMKGRRKEIVREELHAILTSRLGIDQIHSEYGMTELLSQAYSSGQGIFKCPPWMKIFSRDISDPLAIKKDGGRGGINVIDLANINSCAFIATDDMGVVDPDGSFTVLGRLDNSEMRGCNLML